ncbi:MAG: NAD(P)/FAD-dependent oxidoreductase [Candidatus Rokubacteria bacterium]|nr:NAD(P)/FAD-dependent oxidoreductase [Candidatus Rokubacteria bacterium]
MATIVILGGGVGGLVAANTLRRRLDRAHRIVLVDRAAQHIYTPSFLWMMLGWREPGEISRDLGRLERKGIEVVQEEIREIDPARRRVRTERQEVSGDYLIVSLGAEGWLGGVPGLAEAGYNLYDLDGTLRLRDSLRGFREGRVAVLIAGLPFKCPGAPYEAAMLIEASLRGRGPRQRAQVDLYTPEPLPMPVAGKAIGEAVKAMLEGKGIGAHFQHKLQAVDPERKELAFENGQRAGYDLLVVIPPHRCPPVVREAGLVGEAGWVPVDRGSLQTAHERVHALGDVTAIKLPVGLMLPKAGVFAHHQAEVVASNIAAEITGGATRRAFDGFGY